MAANKGLVSYWKLDESSGNAADSVGSNTLTNTNSVTYPAGKINNGALFSNPSSKQLKATATGLPTGTTFSVALWYKGSSPVGDGIMGWGNSGTTGAQRNILISAGNAYFGGNSSDLNSNYAINDGNYHHVVVTCNANAAVIYVDGTSRNSGTLSLVTANQVISIGSRSDSTSFITGNVDEVGIWDRALSAAEVVELYNGYLGKQYPFTGQDYVSFNSTSFIDEVSGSASSLTWAHTCDPRDSKLIVTAYGRTSMSGVTYNGTAMTLIREDFDLSYNYHSSWYLDTPPTGVSYNVVATYSSASTNRGGASVGCSGAKPGVGANNNAASASASTTVNVTTTNANSTLLFLAFANTYLTITDGVGQYEILRNTGSTPVNVLTYKNSNSVASQSGSILYGGGSANLTIQAVELLVGVTEVDYVGITESVSVMSVLNINVSESISITESTPVLRGLGIGLVAAYKLDESSGNAADSSGNGFTLTNNNTVAYAPGLINNAADFGSANTNKYFSSTTNYGITGNFSVSLWVKLNTEISSGIYGFFQTSNTNVNVIYTVSYEYNSGTRRIKVDRVKAGDSFNSGTYNVTLGTSAWNNIILVYNGTTVKAYFNNVEVISVTTSGNGAYGSADGTTVGSLFDYTVGSSSPNNYTSSLIDIVNTWSRSLTTTEIAQLYNNGRGFQYPFEPDALSISVTDSLSITESVSVASILNINVSDSLSITESVTVRETSNISVSDSVSITESVSVSEVNYINVSDSISISDSVTVSTGMFIVENISITESIDIVTSGGEISVTDSVSIAESVTVQIPSIDLSINTFDQISISELFQSDGWLGAIIVSDTLSISESVQMSSSSYISVYDQVGISESITSVATLAAISIVDQVSISDSVQTETVNNISTNDNISYSDSVTMESFRMSPGATPIATVT